MNSERVDDRSGQLLASHRDLQMNRLRRFIQPVDVLFQPEDAPGIGADALEYAVTVEQAMIEHADLGVGLVEQLAGDKDLGAHPRRPSALLRRGFSP